LSRQHFCHVVRREWQENSGKRTAHTSDLFFMKDSIEKGHLTVECCLTVHMIGDHPSKPLQGRKFKKHKALIMGHKSVPSGSMSLV